jgi:hypothetical protein
MAEKIPGNNAEERRQDDLAEAARLSQEFLAGKKLPDAGISLNGQEIRNREDTQAAKNREDAQAHVGKKAQRDESWQGVMEGVDKAAGPRAGAEFRNPNDQGVDFQQIDQAKRDAAWQQVEQTVQKEANIELSPKPGTEFMAGKDRTDVGIDFQQIDQTNKAEASRMAQEGLAAEKAREIAQKAAGNEAYVQDLTGKINKADSQRIKEDVENRADAMISSGLVEEDLIAKRVERVAARKAAAEKLATERAEKERVAAEKAAAKKLEADRKAEEKRAAKIKAAERSKARKEAIKKFGKDVARQTEKVANVGRYVAGEAMETGKHRRKALMRGIKGAVAGWKEGEAARLKREKDEPEKYKVKGEAPIVKIWEKAIKPGAKALYETGKRGVEKIQEYRATRAEKLALAEQAKKEADDKKATELIEAIQRRAAIERDAEQGIDLHSLQSKVEKAVPGSAEKENLVAERNRLAESLTGKTMAERMADAEVATGKNLGYARRMDYVNALTGSERIVAGAEKEKAFLEREFSKLSPKEQQKYGNNFALFQKDLETPMRKMLKDSGLTSEQTHDVIYGLLEAGYKPQSIKKRGFFRSGREMIGPDNKPIKMKTADFLALIRTQGQKYDIGVSVSAQDRLNARWNNEVAKQVELSLAETSHDQNAVIEKAKEGYQKEIVALFARLFESFGGKTASPAEQKKASQPPKIINGDGGSMLGDLASEAGDANKYKAVFSPATIKRMAGLKQEGVEKNVINKVRAILEVLVEALK